MVDLNDFKAINDTFGHAAGDEVLITAARRLVSAVRASDTVARLGGDEFVLIIESVDDPRELIQLGRKLIDTLSDVITLESGINVHVGASVGFALYPKDGSEVSDLLHVADKGMYDCKVSGLMELQ
jgi:diguanylate cyclase (GGDEF)-like protein